MIIFFTLLYFFFKDTATTEIYTYRHTLSLHDALPISIAPTYPVLAGQYMNYLERALLEYKTGDRKNPIMAAQAASLSEDDIKALATYFAEQESPLYTPIVGDATPETP